MSDINQDDIDKLLQDALVGGDPKEESPPPASEEEERGAASQDDIDALFAAVGGDSAPVNPAPAPAPAPTPAPAPKPAPEPEPEGIASQDDIDALFSAVDEAASAAPSGTSESDTVDFDAGSADQDNAADLFESQLAEVDAAAAAAEQSETSDLDALLSSIVGEEPLNESDETSTVETPDVGAIDMEELLKQVSAAAPPPPPKALPSQRPPPADLNLNADTTILDMSSGDISRVLAGAGHTPPASPPPAPPVPPPPAVASAPSIPSAAPGARREYSVLYGAGEVESVANQISALLSSLSEKAHGYMQSWIAADSEAKELRSRALGEERRRSSLEGEKTALTKEIDDLRTRLGQIEGAKITVEEARRTAETSFQSRVRELESHVKLLGSESESLKDELTHARNQATGVDIESRRARFEADRLKSELESERMERLRVQRALENREKELQAVQAQSSGQASSLFIDELHRLVRRLESELDARTSGAHEALKQLDRLDASEAMVPVVANLRAALMRAMGNADDPDDAIKALGREAAGVRGPAALAPGKAELLSFETAISTYNLVGAVEVAGALLREVRATPGLLMRKIYQCPALRRPEVGDNLGDLARLLEGLRTVQEASDRSRGSESGESEVFYVHLFDFLHNLVRLKIVTRMSGDIWRLFLDLRGRFSFVTSDKQWAEYRDGALSDRNVKA